MVVVCSVLVVEVAVVVICSVLIVEVTVVVVFSVVVVEAAVVYVQFVLRQMMLSTVSTEIPSPPSHSLDSQLFELRRLPFFAPHPFLKVHVRWRRQPLNIFRHVDHSDQSQHSSSNMSTVRECLKRFSIYSYKPSARANESAETATRSKNAFISFLLRLDANFE